MKMLLYTLTILLSNIALFSQSLSDKLIYNNGKTLKVIIVNENALHVKFKLDPNQSSSDEKWTNLLTVKYDEISRNMKTAENYFDLKSWSSSIKYYNKVLNRISSRQWEKDKAEYKISLAQLKLKKTSEAVKGFLEIKKNSRWYYPAKFSVLKALPNDKIDPTIETFVSDNTLPSPYKNKLLIILFNRRIANQKTSKASKVLDQIKKLKYKHNNILVKEFEIKLNVQNQKYDTAKDQIEDFIEDENETGAMRIALGDIYLSQNELEKALYEYLRAKVSFKGVKPEASFKAGRTFLKMTQLNKHKSYAKKELRASIASNDGLWSLQSKKLFSQLR